MSTLSKKISLKMPTVEEDQLITAAAESDPDALPFADEQMVEMVPMRILHWRLKLANEKQLAPVSYSPEAIAFFKASGARWQARMHAVLRDFVETQSSDDAKGAWRDDGRTGAGPGKVHSTAASPLAELLYRRPISSLRTITAMNGLIPALPTMAAAALATLLIQGHATAQPALGRFAGSSKYWRPDYVGTLRMRSAGSVSFTAVAEVELQRQQETFPGAGIHDYEMRGLITLTSPLQTTGKGITATCQVLKPVVPVRIGQSRLRLYSGDEEIPKNSYEIKVFQQVPIGECVGSDGSRSTIPFDSMEVSFDSTQMAIDGRPPEPLKLPQAPKPFTPSEQAVADQMTKTAEAMGHHPEMQQGLQALIDRARREGREITAEESYALVERLRRQGVIPEQLPSFRSEREAELRRLGGEQGTIDYSHLRRTPSLDRLEDQLTIQTPWGITKTLEWSLRRTGTTPAPGR